MLPSSLILCSSSSKISSSDWLMYLVRGGWGNRLCWREKIHVTRREERENTKLKFVTSSGFTSSLISFRMEGCSSMLLNMVPTIIHCSLICRSHSLLMGTTPPATHIHSCSECFRQNTTATRACQWLYTWCFSPHFCAALSARTSLICMSLVA